MKTILVPLDGSEHSAEALPVIRSLLLTAERRVHLLRVLPPFDSAAERRERLGGPPSHLSLRLQSASEHLEAVVEDLERFGAEVTAEVRVGEICETILATAAQLDAGLIAMVTHGRHGILRWLKGSVAESILRQSPVPLLLINATHTGDRPLGLPLHGRLLVALDGSPQSTRVLPYAAEIARQLGSHVTLLRCVQGIELVPGVPPAAPVAVPVPLTPDTEAAEAALYDPQESLIAGGIDTDIRIQVGRASQGILQVADDEDADLIAMTTHGREGGRRLLLGSVAESVLRDCARPLLILNTEAEPADAALQRATP